MPPIKTSPQERSAAQTRQAAAILVKADTTLVKEAMKLHGQPAVAECKRVLIQQGFVLADGSIAPAAPVLTPAKVPMPSLLDGPATDAWKVGLADKWHQCSTTRLRALMCKVDPIGMGEANMRTLGKKHAKEPPKGIVLEHFEHVFLIDVTANVPRARCEDDLVECLRAPYVQHGRRALQNPVPIDFETNGSYKVKHESGAWMLVHNYSRQEITLNSIDDPAGTKEVYVENPHADNRAMVKCRCDPNVHLLCVCV